MHLLSDNRRRGETVCDASGAETWVTTHVSVRHQYTQAKVIVAISGIVTAKQKTARTRIHKKKRRRRHKTLRKSRSGTETLHGGTAGQTQVATMAVETLNVLTRASTGYQYKKMELENPPSSHELEALRKGPQVKAIDDFFESRRKAGQVRESKSPHSAPTFCVKKPQGGWRIVHVYNKLNVATIPAQTPIP
ncbi:reverse transcriptase [Phytophthora megakarya]|uniref:Reverse transcriptase n=1 Tax=Phytophthora megakarya TaxID=4795 RepID=A0A225UE89_9STRA|nr:reverse transcriptase [Phytophthora megakarya]